MIHTSGVKWPLLRTCSRKPAQKAGLNLSASHPLLPSAAAKEAPLSPVCLHFQTQTAALSPLSFPNCFINNARHKSGTNSSPASGPDAAGTMVTGMLAHTAARATAASTGAVPGWAGIVKACGRTDATAQVPTFPRFPQPGGTTFDPTD